ncbi:CaiB/BaiF CoA transferase family protein [Prauserella flavalba]|uniref:Carnitine dehydratase n=1 Tax=Prauserella flavalba TaxID=1477506 RepID=A0A318LN50_9PSEU|nr:CoA transferase [Prauserella flavalba]PXY35903.1 carnitine dehydratase [Prauserella flavalba]
MSSSLGDLRVVDFSRVLAGPFATMLLADLGATVTKIERPGTGDDTRGWGPPFDESGQATYFQSVNRNKESITLDLTDAAGLERARALAREADVVVENFRPGLMETLGLGYDDLRADNPGLVYCSITGFGRDKGAELPGYDLLIQALGGLMSITGSPDGEPQKVGVAVVDVFAGLFATVGMLAAVRHRDATGEGQRVEINLLSSLLAALVNQGTGYTAGGVVPARMGNAHPSVSPYEVLPCGEGDLVLAVGNDRQFAVLCERLGAPDLAEDPRYATNTARVRNRESLRAELVRLLGERPAADWAKELSAARVPAGVVNDLAGAFRLAADLGLDPIVSIPRDDGTAARLTRNPIGLSATPPAYRSAPPPLS